jgi:hypothetical protein
VDPVKQSRRGVAGLWHEGSFAVAQCCTSNVIAVVWPDGLLSGELSFKRDLVRVTELVSLVPPHSAVQRPVSRRAQTGKRHQTSSLLDLRAMAVRLLSTYADLGLSRVTASEAQFRDTLTRPRMSRLVGLAISKTRSIFMGPKRDR